MPPPTIVPEITIEMPELDSYDDLARVAPVGEDAEDMPVATGIGTALGVEAVA